MSFFDFLFGGQDAGTDSLIDQATADPKLDPSSGDGGASYSGYSLDDILSGISATNIESKWLMSDQTYIDWSNKVGGAQVDAGKTVEASKGMTAGGNSSGSLLDKVGGFVEKNKSLTEMVLKGIGGATAASQAKKLAEQNSRNRIGELQEADRLKQADNARISASVSGLRAPGIIRRQMPLKRIDGTNVFNNGKIGG